MSVKKISLLALFLALSVVGASIKIPSFVGSIALDAFPALLAAAVIGWRAGGILAGLAHLISAFIAGIPLGPAHFIIAIEMALIVGVFGLICKAGKHKSATVIFILSNALLAPLPMIYLYDAAFYIAIVPSLVIGSSFNAMAAHITIPKFEDVFQKMAWESSR